MRLLKINKSYGFTLIELILVITIFSFMFGMASLVLGNFMNNRALRTDGEMIVQTIREARTMAIAQNQDSSWGVYFDNSSSPRKYVLFKGLSYAARDNSFDRINELHSNVAYQTISLNGGAQETIFSKRSGQTDQFGAVVLQYQDEIFDIDINAMGAIDYTY
jgi:prepilin-type N-terminal cleavage/methylation domain-containing protein